jgi:hypothetical protein
MIAEEEIGRYRDIKQHCDQRPFFFLPNLRIKDDHTNQQYGFLYILPKKSPSHSKCAMY